MSHYLNCLVRGNFVMGKKCHFLPMLFFHGQKFHIFTLEESKVRKIEDYWKS